MDWIASSAATDNYINSTMYAGLGQGEGIDLRMEMHAILYGGLGKVGKGHWVILRKYDRARPSKYYNKRTHEGVDGPAFEYTDELLRTRQVPLSKYNDQLLSIKPGIDIDDMYVYYFEYMVNPKIGDDILELNLPDNGPTPILANVTPIARYTIKRTHPYRLENGNIQYWMALAKYNEVSH